MIGVHDVDVDVGDDSLLFIFYFPYNKDKGEKINGNTRIHYDFKYCPKDNI